MKPHEKTEYLEIHFEIVATITKQLENDFSFSNFTRENYGLGGLYELAEDLTDKFHKKYQYEIWDGNFLDTLDEFLKDKV